jgi:tRNA dimethylallyltransferase
MITILGPTASGKTTLAVAVARLFGGEIISADSRQVYDRLFLGVGKDLETYSEGGVFVPYHLIGHVSLDRDYDLFSFKQDFLRSHQDIVARGKSPILCGGTGLYLEAVLLDYDLTPVPEDLLWRNRAEQLSDEALVAYFLSLATPHNHTDTADRARLIRAIELAMHHQTRSKQNPSSFDHGVVFGIDWDPSVLRDRIRLRLAQRIQSGMLLEVSDLLASGVSMDRLDRLGLEYRYCLQCLRGDVSEAAMVLLLGREICRYAKRQRTWFRRMEKRGVSISWIPGDWSLEKQVMHVKKVVESKGVFL